MSATRVAAWTKTEDGNPVGTVTIAAGSNRKFVVIVQAETTGQPTSNTFTIGGQTYTESFEDYFDNGAQDCWLYAYIWNEAAIAAMSGSTISYNITGTQNARLWAYAMIQDTNQGVTFKSATQSSGSDTFNVTTTSSAGDFIVVLSMAPNVSRDITNMDTLAEIYDVTPGPGTFAAHLGDGDGGDSTTTFTGDGTTGIYTAIGLVFAAAAAGNPHYYYAQQ